MRSPSAQVVVKREVLNAYANEIEVDGRTLEDLQLLFEGRLAARMTE
jgi:hypothetical protein